MPRGPHKLCSGPSSRGFPIAACVGDRIRLAEHAPELADKNLQHPFKYLLHRERRQQQRHHHRNTAAIAGPLKLSSSTALPDFIW